MSVERDASNSAILVFWYLYEVDRDFTGERGVTFIKREYQVRNALHVIIVACYTIVCNERGNLE